MFTILLVSRIIASVNISSLTIDTSSIHLGMKPKRGGKPAKDRAATSIVREENFSSSMLSIVSILCLTAVRITVTVMTVYANINVKNSCVLMSILLISHPTLNSDDKARISFSFLTPICEKDPMRADRIILSITKTL
jgi:hypothetical protein